MRFSDLKAAWQAHPAGCFRLTFAGGARRRARELRLVGGVAAFQLVDEVEANPGIWGISSTRFSTPGAITQAEPLAEAECRTVARPAGMARKRKAPISAPYLLAPPYGLFGLAALSLLLFAVELAAFSLAHGTLSRASGGWAKAGLQMASYPVAAALAAAWALRRRPAYRLLNRFQPQWQSIGLAFAVGVGFTLALQLVQHGWQAPARSTLLARFGAAAMVIQLAAIVPNELLERGVLQASLLAYMPPWPAMLLGAEAVALLHGNPLGALPLELAAAIVYRKAGNSLPAAAAFHAANYLTFLALLRWM